MARPLTPKQALFVQEYLVDLNATAAYKRAGYIGRGSTADTNASRLLRNAQVKAAVAAGQAARGKRVGVSADEVVQELKRVAFLDARRIFEWGPDGVKVKPSAGLSPDEAACIAEVSETVTEAGGAIRLKLADKMKALEMLAKHLGMFVDRVEHSGPGGKPIAFQDVTDADLAAEIARLQNV